MGGTVSTLSKCASADGRYDTCVGPRSWFWYLVPILILILTILAFAFVFMVPGLDLSNGMVIGILVTTIIAAILAAVMIYYVYAYNFSCSGPCDAVVDCPTAAAAFVAPRQAVYVGPGAAMTENVIVERRPMPPAGPPPTGQRARAAAELQRFADVQQAEAARAQAAAADVSEDDAGERP